MDTQHSSNANSALISSLESVDAEHNPFLYSVNKYVASHASQKLRILAENNQAVEQGTSTFILPRLGYLCDMTLSWGVNVPATYTTGGGEYAGHPAFVPSGRGMVEMIERITWCNESREIFSLSGNALLALYSDLSLENRIAFSKSVHCLADPLQDAIYQDSGDAHKRTSDAASGYLTCHLPIMMCLSSQPSLFPNLSFLSNCQCKVTWSSKFSEKFNVVYTVATDNGADPAVITHQVGGMAKFDADCQVTIEQSTVALTCNFISLPQELQSKTIESNYGSGALSQLTWDMLDFPIQTVELPFAYGGVEWPTVSVPLQTTKAISDLYVMCYIPKSELRDDAFSATHDCRIVNTANLPMQVESIGLSASGQQIVEQCPAEQLRYWGRRTMNGENGGWWATSTSSGGFKNRLSGTFADAPAAANYDSLNGAFVYKINLAALSSNKNFNSGMLSFRELSSAMLTVKLAKPVTSGTFADSQSRNGVDWPIVPPQGAAPAFTGNDQPFLSVGGDGNQIKMHIAVIARTNSIVNTDSQAGRQTGLLSN
jgi:hypothetical protein